MVAHRVETFQKWVSPTLLPSLPLLFCIIITSSFSWLSSPRPPLIRNIQQVYSAQPYSSNTVSRRTSKSNKHDNHELRCTRGRQCLLGPKVSPRTGMSFIILSSTNTKKHSHSDTRMTDNPVGLLLKLSSASTTR